MTNPAACTEFDEIDEVAGVRDFIGLSTPGLARLETTGFRFHSQATAPDSTPLSGADRR